MLNIVIPMAGRGQRFSEAGYSSPKPLIDVFGKPMIAQVIRNLRPNRPHRFVFLCLEDHLAKQDLSNIFEQECDQFEIIPIQKVTRGAAETVLAAEAHIDGSSPLMIANCDQYIAHSIDDYLHAFESSDHDGYIMTMFADDPKWSYVRLDSAGSIVEVVEKEVVSNEATVGIYNFRVGSDYVSAAKRMIERNLVVNGEFYVAPVYNLLLEVGKTVGYFHIRGIGEEMFGLGTPKDLTKFLRLKQLPIISTIA